MPTQSPAIQLSIAQARRIAVDSSLLGPRSGLGRGSKGVLKLLQRLGYIQIDSISVVNRAHHHIPWTRLPGYRNGGIYRMLKRGQVFEHWGHGASFLPMEDFRFYLPLMRRYRERPSPYVKEATRKHSKLFQPILERIASEGPMSSADFGEEHGGRRGAWWDWKPAKMALELLLWRGELLVSERRGFQRIYDLPERVIPEGTDLTEPDEDMVARFIVERALGSMGLARPKDIRNYFYMGRRFPVDNAIRAMLNSGAIVEAGLAGQSGRWLLPGRLAQVKGRPGPRKAMLHLLSPFDYIVTNRDRALAIFGFDYRIECYTPAAKRQFGYFCLPLLWGDGFAGRLDARADRSGRKLIVNSLHLEDGHSAGAEFEVALADRLRSYAGFNDCEQVELKAAGRNVSPAMLARIRKQL